MTALLITFSLVLVRFPAAFGDSPPTWTHLPGILVYGISAVVLSTRGARLDVNGRRIALVGLFIALIVVSLFRAAFDDREFTVKIAIADSTTLVAVAAFVTAAFGLADRQRRRSLFVAAALAPLVFVITNVVLYLVGITGGDAGTASGSYAQSQLLGFLGVSFDRVRFPLSSGLNGVGDSAGAAVVGCTILALSAWRGYARVAGALGSGLALIVLLGVDTRGALVGAIAAIGLVIAFGRGGRRLAQWLPLIVPVGPAIVLTVLGAFAGTGLADRLSRGSNDFTSGTGRADIWHEVASYLASHLGVETVFGSGAYGQIATGVSYDYSYALSGYVRPELATAHSLPLQTILDTGLVGLGALLAVAALSLKGLVTLDQRSVHGARACLGVLVFLLLAGVFEATPSVYAPDALVLFVITAIAGSVGLAPPTVGRASRPDVSVARFPATSLSSPGGGA